MLVSSKHLSHHETHIQQRYMKMHGDRDGVGIEEGWRRDIVDICAAASSR